MKNATKEKKNPRTIRIEDSKIFLLQEILGERFNFNRFIQSQIDDFLKSKKKRAFNKLMELNEVKSDWRIPVSFSEKEKALLQKEARQSYLSMSQEIRRRVLSTFKTSVLLSKSDRDDLAKVNYKLAKIGSNINQIAKYLNSAASQKGLVKINENQGANIERNLETLEGALEETKAMFARFLDKSS